MFLACLPTVFIIENDYEILVNTTYPGMVWVTVNEKRYYPANCGVLPCSGKVSKIRIPQSELDCCGEYFIHFKRTVDKRSYYPVFGEEEYERYSFKPVSADAEIKMYHIADVHYNFEAAEKTSGYFGDKVDLFVFNGDLGEANTVENYLDVCRFTGNVTRGVVPCVFSRGNHDTRGALAELYTDYFPSVGKNTYYTFETKSIFGIVLDCGEDKDDSHPEYGGANAFHDFRIRELEFLKLIEPREGKLTFAICHIAPVGRCDECGGCFDIEKDVYTAWNRELERLGISFMLSGHVHRAYVLYPNDKRSQRSHKYPVIVGAERYNSGVIGTALTVGDDLLVGFTDSEGICRSQYHIDML